MKLLRILHELIVASIRIGKMMRGLLDNDNSTWRRVVITRCGLRSVYPLLNHCESPIDCTGISTSAIEIRRFIWTTSDIRCPCKQILRDKPFIDFLAFAWEFANPVWFTVNLRECPCYCDFPIVRQENLTRVIIKRVTCAVSSSIYTILRFKCCRSWIRCCCISIPC